MNKTILLLIILLLIPNVLAQNSIKLLAVNEANKEGTIVDLNLEIVDGSGGVFVETLPLSNIDTQISLRIGKTIACKTTENYCLDKDFIYSMKTTAPVVAGPSAGAAITLLTIASLENKKLDSDVVITGTINSGGVIGPVGGIKEKMYAAYSAKLKTVLIPKGETNASEMIEYGKKLNLSVIEVSDIEEAYEIFTKEKNIQKEIVVNEKYKEIMKELNKDICGRNEIIVKDIEKLNTTNDKTIELGLNLSAEAKELYDEGLYYSSASRCFGSNVYLREGLFRIKNLSDKDIKDQFKFVENRLKELEKELNSTKIENLGDLETAMIVRERIYDATKNLEESNKTNSLRDLSYAIERTISAVTWKKFMGFSDKQIDESKLRDSCLIKMQEVQELYNYVSIYLPTLLDETKNEFDKTKGYFDSQDYVLCLFKASKSEAEINAALSTIYIEDSNVMQLLNNKILAAKKTIIKQIDKGNFPILGYSYYEYAGALNETEKYTALLYAEYGIELSNLDIYFPTKKPLGIKINEKALITLIMGFIIGVSLFYIKRHYKRKKIILKRKH